MIHKLKCLKNQFFVFIKKKLKYVNVKKGTIAKEIIYKRNNTV